MLSDYQSPTLEIAYLNDDESVLSISLDQTEDSKWTPNVVPGAFNKTP